MKHPSRFLIFATSAVVACTIAAARAHAAPPETTVKSQIVLTANEKEAVAAFNKRTSDYESLHKRLNASLPKLPDKATPEQIDKHQQSMVSLIRKERKNAKPGEFFTPAMVALVKRASAATVAGSSGQMNKATIMDENPGTLPNVTVNDKYPEELAISSMPPELLETLPKLPEGQEYRFLGKRLILVDSCCQLVLDVTPNVLV